MVDFRGLSSFKEWIQTAGKNNPLLVALLCVAFVFRLAGVFWGIPPFDSNYYHPDEPKIIDGAFQFPRHIFTNYDLRYPTAYPYILGALIWPAKKILTLSGFDAYSFVFMNGRIFSVILGTLAVLFTYLLVTRAFLDKRRGLIAACVLAFSMFHVTNSALATTDVATSFWLVLFLYLLIPSIERQSLRGALASGVTLGMLVGTKYTGLIAVIPLFLLVFRYHMSRNWGSLWPCAVVAFPTDKILWIVGIASICTFLLTTPGIVLHPHSFVLSLLSENARSAAMRHPLYQFDSWVVIFTRLTQTIGLPLVLCSFVGLCIASTSRHAFDVALAALVAAFFLFFGTALLQRYVIMIMPVLAVLSSGSLSLLLSAGPRWVRGAGAVLCIGILVHASWYSASAVLSRYPDTRTIAAEYIREHIPPGSTIGIAYTSQEYPWPNHIWRYPKIDFNVFKYVDFLEAPEFVVVSSYDAEPIRDVLQSGVLSQNFVFPASRASEWYKNSPPGSEIFAFFQGLSESKIGQYQRLKSFSPKRSLAPIESPVPTIEIFQRPPNGTAALRSAGTACAISQMDIGSLSLGTSAQQAKGRSCLPHSRSTVGRIEGCD
jgi:hypothetical protein